MTGTVESMSRTENQNRSRSPTGAGTKSTKSKSMARWKAEEELVIKREFKKYVNDIKANLIL